MISELAAFAGGVLFGRQELRLWEARMQKKHMLTLRLLV